MIIFFMWKLHVIMIVRDLMHFIFVENSQILDMSFYFMENLTSIHIIICLWDTNNRSHFYFLLYKHYYLNKKKIFLFLFLHKRNEHAHQSSQEGTSKKGKFSCTHYCYYYYMTQNPKKKIICNISPYILLLLLTRINTYSFVRECVTFKLLMFFAYTRMYIKYHHLLKILNILWWSWLTYHQLW